MDKTQTEIEAWLVERLSNLLGIEAQRIDVERPLTRYGLDSIVALELTAELEDWLQQTMPESLMWDQPSIRALAQYLSGAEAVSPIDGEFHEEAATVVPTTAQPSHLETVLHQEKGSDNIAARFSNSVEPIAIVGLACRLPGASTPEAFWQLLRNGIEALSEVPYERWDVESLNELESAVPGKMTGRVGGFLKDIDLFDPHFFKISPREAAHIDPQQRLLLEVSWEALEHAGQAPDKLAGSATGVFIGISTSDYIKNYYANLNAIDAYTNIGNAHSIAASRISYFLDLHGPSMAIDTACSSSLVAIHLACQSLRSGETTLALAGGVNVMLSPDPTISFSKARMISASGHCRPFDANADGLVRGEGCAVIVLKRLSDAHADGNRILGLIRGTAMNQDGRGNGLTAPNENAQQAVIRQALKQAGIAPSQLRYIVGQGTGTSLGDAVELQALASVLHEGHTNSQRCALGSVKANIGHLEAAAGVTSVIAALLALQHEEIPPQLHFQQLNPRVSAEQLPLLIPTAPEPWLKEQEPRFAGVSAFSISGTNVHLVLEDAPAVLPKTTSSERPLHLLTLSAQNEYALHDLINAYKHYLSTTDASVPDMCFTANTGRVHFSHRVAVVADTRDHLLSTLHAFGSSAQSGSLVTGNADFAQPRVAFLFSGEGTEYEQMGRELYESQPVFRAAIQRCAAILKEDLDGLLISALYPASDGPHLLQKSIYTQPALFALEYALAEVWRSWGIMPQAVLGYGVGAYVAACVAGALDLEDALRLVFERARLLQAIPQADSAMLVHASEARVTELLTPFRSQASLAAVVAPNCMLIACEPTILQEIDQTCSSLGITTGPAPFSYTYRLSSRAAFTDALLRAANIVPYERLAIPFVSTLTGEALRPGDRLNAEYWGRHLSEPIQFGQSIETLARQGIQFFLEIGASAALCRLGQNELSLEHASWLPSLSQQDQSVWQTMLTSLSTLYVNGCTIDWSAFHAGYSGQRISLPTYAFQRERCWITPAQSQPVPAKQAVAHEGIRHPLLGRRVRLEA